MSKRYQSLQDFQDATFARLRRVLQNPPLRFLIRNVVGGGDQEWASVELLAKDAVCKNGMFQSFSMTRASMGPRCAFCRTCALIIMPPCLSKRSCLPDDLLLVLEIFRERRYRSGAGLS